jgi:hypothetical protein
LQWNLVRIASGYMPALGREGLNAKVQRLKAGPPNSWHFLTGWHWR